MKNQKEQIEQMKNDICKIINDTMYHLLDEDDSKYLAEILYDEGYRKQSEGEWGFDGMSWTCSECGEYAPIDKHRNTIKSKFCPNCGAHMKVTLEPKNYPPYLDRPKGGTE